MRGRVSQVGDTRVSPNGYQYTRTEQGWRLTHHLVAEKKLGRPLRENERVSFVNGKKRDLSPDNIQVSEKGRGSLRRRLAQVEARITELEAEREALLHEIKRTS